MLSYWTLLVAPVLEDWAEVKRKKSGCRIENGLEGFRDVTAYMKGKTALTAVRVDSAASVFSHALS